MTHPTDRSSQYAGLSSAQPPGYTPLPPTPDTSGIFHRRALDAHDPAPPAPRPRPRIALIALVAVPALIVVAVGVWALAFG